MKSFFHYKKQHLYFQSLLFCNLFLKKNISKQKRFDSTIYMSPFSNQQSLKHIPALCRVHSSGLNECETN